jgi:DNA-binding NarL/FixJ family response regulator
MTYVQDEFSETFLSRRERNGAMAFFGLVAALTFFDVIEDAVEGASFYHIIPEVVTAVIALIAAVLLFIRFARDRNQTLVLTKEKLKSVQSDKEEWKKLAESYQKGITEGIIKQFSLWNLTPAEQDVSFFLLKGFSIQEIAAIRDVSERTVRQQASIIYKKSSLSGRAQLSAFFLEDLLAPNSAPLSD